MARIVKQHKGYKIKETSKRDHTDYRYWVCLPEDHQFVDWECDTLQEAIDFIDSKFQDAAKQKKMNIGPRSRSMPQSSRPRGGIHRG